MRKRDRDLRTPALVVALLLSLMLWLVVGLPQLVGAERAFANIAAERTLVDADGNVREYGYGQISFNGRGPEAWRWQTLKARAARDELQRRLTASVLQVRSLKRTLAHDPSVQEALALACTIYGHCKTLKRKAFCESRLDPNARNRSSSARGLLQFLTEGRARHYRGGWSQGGTWDTTPFYAFSVYSPYANALAAGWMHDEGRGGEWECR